MSSFPPPQLLARPGSTDTPGRIATIEDVAHCYRLFLDREMENLQAGEGHLADEPDLWTLIRKFHGAPENLLGKVFAASRFIQAVQDARNIDLALTDAQRAELTQHIEAVWRRYGRENAYYSVLTHPGYLADRITTANVEHFYETGAIELDAFRLVCARNGVEPDPRWSICELGCGVARVGAAFARQFAAYLGVDISAEHLAIARERLEAQGSGAPSLQLLPEFLSGTEGYDVFYSAIVLQHNPPPIIHQLLDACLARVNPGGYAYFQLPCYLDGYRFDVASYLAGAGRRDEMEMHALPQREVFALLAKHGLTPVEVVPDGRIGPIGMSYAFFARKDAQI
jgi:SAM-dependent methyltransferase